jgi:hypothetical protein
LPAAGGVCCATNSEGISARTVVGAVAHGPERSAASCQTRRAEKLENKSWHVGPVLSILAGITIPRVPRLSNYAIAIYQILVWILGLLGPGALYWT